MVESHFFRPQTFVIKKFEKAAHITLVGQPCVLRQPLFKKQIDEIFAQYFRIFFLFKPAVVYFGVQPASFGRLCAGCRQFIINNVAIVHITRFFVTLQSICKSNYF